VRCNRKATFHYKGKLQEVFRAGLNEIKYDYVHLNNRIALNLGKRYLCKRVDSKQHFCLQYHVAATDMKALCKKQKTLQAVVYLAFTVHGDKLSSSAPQPVRGSIK